MGREGRTEVFRQEEDRNDVQPERKDLGQDHERMPRLYLDGDHDELVEDEGGERDGHDVDELVLKQDERGDHDRSACDWSAWCGATREGRTLVDANHEPGEEGLVRKRAAL